MRLFSLKYKLARVISMLSPAKAEGTRVLMYHSTFSLDKGETPVDWFAVESKLFKKQIQNLLDQGWEVVPFSKVFEHKDGKFFAITFDDGFKDNFDNVADWLIEKKIPFTVFVVSDFLSDQHPDYVDVETLKKYAENSLLEVGGHGKSHRPLTELSDEELADELAGSKSVLEEITGRPVESMSFPHGKYTKREISTALNSGFKTLGTSVARACSFKQKPLANRHAIFTFDSVKDVESKMRGKWDWMARETL